ncbi:MAG: hypothetical protein AAFQ02_03965 [Bacteroidota bacterium]
MTSAHDIFISAQRYWWSCAAAVIVVMIGCCGVIRASGYDVNGSLIILVVVVLGIGYLWYRQRPTTKTMRQNLHQAYPGLEYSLELLDRPEHELRPLEKVQRETVLRVLPEVKAPMSIVSTAWKSACIAVIGLAVFFGLYLWQHSGTSEDLYALPPYQDTASSSMDRTEALLTLHEVRAHISAPDYTKLRRMSLTDVDLRVAEGSTVSWSFDTEGTITLGAVIIGGEESLEISGLESGRSASLAQPTFYQYELVGVDSTIISDYHPIAVIPDLPPEVQITGLPEYQRRNWDDSTRVNFGIRLSDDYRLSEAHLVATVATGQGESVKFREKDYPLTVDDRQRRTLAHAFDLEEFGMEPGDELYFYVRAKDNCTLRDQWTRSTTYFVVIPDTTTYLWAEDDGVQVDLMPDFFRSQRQIIIDSKSLLADRSSITTEEFNRRSNELGYDQKLLRLKYGQFLGEESESGIAIQNEIDPSALTEEQHKHDHDHDHSNNERWAYLLKAYMHDHDHKDEAEEKASSKSPVDAFMHDHGHVHESDVSFGEETEDPLRPSWVEELSHNHDNEEQATFHEVSVKTKLKMAMSHMWDAELHLRLYDAQTSLPYQYKSLELLQEIKNHARIYVHRIGFDPPKIKEPETRLAGELNEVVDPLYLPEEKEDDDVAGYIREVLRMKSYCDGAEQGSTALSTALDNVSAYLSTMVGTDPGIVIVLSRIASFSRGELPCEPLLESLLDAIPEMESEPTPARLYSHPLTDAVIRDVETLR